MKWRPYRPRGTNEAELSESDKQEYTAEARSDNSPLFFAVQFCSRKIHPNGDRLRSQDCALDEKIWQRHVFYFCVCVGCSAINPKFRPILSDTNPQWMRYWEMNVFKAKSYTLLSEIFYHPQATAHEKPSQVSIFIDYEKDFWVDFSFETLLETFTKQIWCSKISSDGLGSTVEISIYLSTIWQFLLTSVKSPPPLFQFM